MFSSPHIYSSCIQTGLRNCGPLIAHGLARYGLGDALIEAAESLSPHELNIYLVQWREALCTVLRTDSEGYIGRRCVTLARSVPDAFPDPAVLCAYVMPLTSWSMGHVPA